MVINFFYIYSMPKKILLILFIICISGFAKAQTADKVYEQYADFSEATLKHNTTKALTIGEGIIPNVDKLPQKTRIAFFNGLAKMYENSQQPNKAIYYYEIVEVAQPDYYVAHRALGYLYLITVSDLYKKVTASTTDKAEKDKRITAYRNAMLKALPQLEKAQACDPSDDTLKIIKMLYTRLDDKQGLSSLNSRLTNLSKKCIDILTY
ncbi:MAG: hypothetical protein JWQ06_584 [Mucilaginibacter sp.]|nr:hypothetical protein [Mucilaginibacter sp.]